MKNDRNASLLTKNKLGNINGQDGQLHYLEAVDAFARLTYQSVYVIDYTDMSFEYISPNPLFLNGHTAEAVLQMGYDFYFKNVPTQDLELLTLINETGFDFYDRLPVEERKLYSITYDFHLVQPDGKQLLINHKLTPLLLTAEGRMWKSMCIVSLSHYKTAGNARIYKQGSPDLWELLTGKRIWRKQEKPVFSDREIEVLRLHAQGLTINEIAERIFVSPDTVKYYRRKIFERLEVDNIVAALAYAVNSKII